MTVQNSDSGRKVWVSILVVVGVLLLILANVVFWAYFTLLNTDGWVAAVGPLSKEPDIAAFVSLYVVEDLFEQAGLYEVVELGLPEDLQHFSGLLVISLEQIVDQEIFKLLISDVFNDVWRTFNRVSHAVVLDVLKGRGKPQYLLDGDLTLHYADLYQFIRDELEFDDPNWAFQAEALRLTILQKRHVAVMQEIVSLLTTFGLVLPVLTVITFGAAIWISLWRRETVMWSGIATAVSMFVSLLTFLGLRSYAIISIQEPFLRDLGREIIHAFTRSLMLQTLFLTFVGLLIALGAWQAAPDSALRTWYTAHGWRPATSTEKGTNESES